MPEEAESANMPTNPTSVTMTVTSPAVNNASTAVESNAQSDGNGCVNRGNCCMKTRMCLESARFSFLLGMLFFLGGALLIGFSSRLSSGDYFLIGPFSLAAGVILFIRGCITKVAKRQQLRDARERERRLAERARNPARDRSQRNEELALSQDNLIIPPDYFEVVTPKTTATVDPSQVEMIHEGSQANFDSVSDLPVLTGKPRLLRLSSVQSQTTFPDMVSVAVDTSDLPTELVRTASQLPPSYFSATHHQRPSPDELPESSSAAELSSVAESSSAAETRFSLPPEDP